jgi:cytochrome c oxidase subunit 1
MSSDITQQPRPAPDSPDPSPEPLGPRRKPDYINVRFGILSWLFTLDHKRIAILYLVSITLSFFVGGFYAMLIRLELATPQGDLFSSGDEYNKAFTLHGVVMLFLFLIPAIPAVFGNFLVPLMIGAKDMAFPKLNLLSYYVYVLGAILILTSLFYGGVDTGWTFYTPYSTRSSHSYVLLTGLGAFVVGFSSILTGLNIIVTVHKMRAPGLTWFKLPLFIWSIYSTSIIQLLGTPVVAMAILLLAVERFTGFGIFDPRMGGDPILFQHIFWFYSHPAVYIMILPAMGVVSELIPPFTRKPVFGYKFVAMASVAIAAVGFLVWGHHMFVSGQSMYAGLIFSFLSYVVAVPSAVKVFNWTASLHKASISFQVPLLYAFGFIGLFTIGGLTGLVLAAMAVDVHVHDTYFVIAHFHYIMVGGTIMAYMGAIHYWWPKMTGCMYPEGLAKLACLIIFVGFNLTFFPQFIVGYQGMNRRYWTYAPEFQVLNVLSSAGASILAVGYALPLFYLLWSLFYAKEAGPNPWGATGLEWQTQSPPMPDNFDETPTVVNPPYHFAVTRQEAEHVGS